MKSPQHATAVGLLHYGAKQSREGRVSLRSGEGSSVRDRLVGWIMELF